MSTREDLIEIAARALSDRAHGHEDFVSWDDLAAAVIDALTEADAFGVAVLTEALRDAIQSIERQQPHPESRAGLLVARLRAVLGGSNTP